MINFGLDTRTQAEKSYELSLQKDAGYEQTEDFDAVRTKAAEDYVAAEEDALLRYSEDSISFEDS